MKILVKIKNFFLKQYTEYVRAKNHIDLCLPLSSPKVWESRLALVGILLFLSSKLYFNDLFLTSIGLMCISIPIVSNAYRNIFKDIIPALKMGGLQKAYKPSFGLSLPKRYVHTYMFIKSAKLAFKMCALCYGGVVATEAFYSGVHHMSFLNEVGRVYYKEQTFEQALEHLSNPKKYKGSDPLLQDFKELVAAKDAQHNAELAAKDAIIEELLKGHKK
jgi:hypothetical protein